MKLNSTATKTLQALRAGEMTSAELGERFGTGYEIASLLRSGLIEQTQFGYKITDLGRQNCPNRRNTMPPAAKSVTKKQPAMLVAVPARGMSDLANRLSDKSVATPFPPIRPSTLKTESETKMTQQPNDAITATSTALLMLQCMGAYPKLTMPEISKVIDRQCGPSYIPSYIEHGLVVVEQNSEGKKIYSLQDGLTAFDVYSHRSTKKSEALKQKVEQISQPAPAVEAVPQFIAAAEEPTISNMETVAESDITINLKGEAAADFKETLLSQMKPAKPSVRYAFTSEHTFIIYGVADQYIELTKEQTEALFDFVESAALMLPASGFSIGGAAL